MRMFRDQKIDYLKYNRSLQNVTSPNFQARGPLRLLNIFTQFDLSSKQIKYIKLVTAGRSRGTQDSYNRTLDRLNKYLKKNGSNILTLSEDSLLEYIVNLEETKAPFCHVSGLAGAIEFLCAALRQTNIWSASIERYYVAIIRRSASERKPRKKAPLLPLSVLKNAVATFITPFLDNPDKVLIHLF